MHFELKHNFESLKSMAASLNYIYFESRISDVEGEEDTIILRRKGEDVFKVKRANDTAIFFAENDCAWEPMFRLAQELNELEGLFRGGYKEQFQKVGTLALVRNRLMLAVACGGNGPDVSLKQFDQYKGREALVYFDPEDSTVHLTNFEDLRPFFQPC